MSQSETIVGLGARTDYVAQVPGADPARLRLTEEEAALLARVGRFARLDQLLAESGLGEARTIAVLLSLRAKGAIAPARIHRPQGRPPVDAALTEEVDLPEERKKEILELERTLDTANHFELLGVAPTATAEQVRQAYYAASKRFHPDRFFGKNLGSFKYRVDRIFRRLTEAYNALNDADRRAAYLEANPHLQPAPPAAPPAPQRPVQDPARAAERRDRMARHPYLLKSARMTELLTRARGHIQQGAPGMALADLHLASQLDPQNKEVQLLLAEARRKHDAQRAQEELARAEEAEKQGDPATAASRYRAAATLDSGNARAAYKAAAFLRHTAQDPREVRLLAQRAVDLDPRNADARVLLAVILAEGDLKKLAKKQLEEALQLNPTHAEAKKQLKKMRWPF